MELIQAGIISIMWISSAATAIVLSEPDIMFLPLIGMVVFCNN